MELNEVFLTSPRRIILPLSPHALQRNQSLQEQAYQALRVAILSGELAPGQRLVETHLAEKLLVSRTPIREAIRQLQHEDLVTMDANRVLRVATISITDALQLYDCRIALEQLSVAEACQNATDTQLQNLNLMLTKADKLVQGKSSPLTTFQLLDLDYHFHRLLAESSGNSWLIFLLDQVFDKMMLLRIQTTQNNREVLEIRTEHRRIYEAISQRDPEAAVHAIKNHLIASKERVAHELQNLEQDTGIIQED